MKAAEVNAMVLLRALVLLACGLGSSALWAQQRLVVPLDPAFRDDPTARAEAEDTEQPLAIRLQPMLAFLPASTAAVPSQLPWPVSGKSMKDIYLSFAPAEDAVKGVTKCSDTHYPPHLAVDIATPSGTSVYPIAAGTLIRYASDGLWGVAAIISHDNGAWSTVTWHLDPNGPQLAKNTAVKTTTMIGKTIHLDPSLGDRDHVHLGIRVPYDYSASARGIGDCGSSNMFAFIDPLTKLSHRDFVIADDDTTMNGSNAWIASTKVWTSSTFVPLYHGRGYRVSNDAAATFSYTVQIPSSGNYDMYVRIAPDANRTSKAQYTITSGTMQPVTVTMNQQTAAAGQWLWFAACLNATGGKTVTVTARNGTASGYLAADAILFEKR